MKKIFLSIIFTCFIVFAFAGGQKETGRDQASATAENGQLISTGMIDSVNYLFDFEIETTNDTDLPLKVSVDLLKDQIWELGELISFRIALQSNSKEYFNKEVSGNYIIYVQNPELWNKTNFKNFVISLPKKYPNLNFYTFDFSTYSINLATEKTIEYQIQYQQNKNKNYNNSLAFQKILESLEKNNIKDRTQVIWITDENIVETTSDAKFFSFATNVMGSVDTTFSYLGYGETPNWTLLNTDLVDLNGNTYFADDEEEIIEKLDNDILYFTFPAIEDINIEVKTETGTYIKNYFYPKSIYGTIKDFSATKHNGGETSHYLGGMNYDETNRFIQYVSLPRLTYLKQIEYMPNLEDNRYKFGEVYVDYYVPMLDKRFYHKEDLYITYVKAEEMNEEMNKYVYADTIIQNTPFVIMEIAELSKYSSKYLIAIQLVNKQRALLEEILEIRPDKAVEQDIELLKQYYEILYKQAKVLNLIQ